MKNFKKWLKYALIRAVRTMAQTCLGIIGASTLLSQVNWLEVISASVLASLISLLMSIAGLPEVEKR